MPSTDEGERESGRDRYNYRERKTGSCILVFPCLFVGIRSLNCMGPRDAGQCSVSGEETYCF